MTVYIHALREEGDVTYPATYLYVSGFLSTPSARRATEVVPDDAVWHKISIHALREEGDAISGFDLNASSAFLSTPSARRATSLAAFLFSSVTISIHALREEGDCKYMQQVYHQKNISIHALREEGDNITIILTTKDCYISIHALREEGDLHEGDVGVAGVRFLSTPSARRATLDGSAAMPCSCNFYPRPPRGGRHVLFELVRVAARISIHALREEGDLPARPVFYLVMRFLSTPSARRATCAAGQASSGT